MLRKLARYGALALGVVAVLILAGGVYARGQVRASLPIVAGTQQIPGLAAEVTVERDSIGVPTIAGRSREDAARALGFVHAQDRLFQMDLQRRQPAGELAALVGPRALAVDQEARVHRFRDVARRALERTAPSYRRVLEAYAEGVNAGVTALGAAPFEYLVLRAIPERWKAEDSILTILAMFNTLQGRQTLFEQTLGAMRDSMPEPMYRFLAAPGSEWETPVIGEALTRPPVPGPEIVNIRQGPIIDTRAGRKLEEEDHSIIGSNNWAVSGAHTASGAPLVANDMHLSIGVPIIWYRASMLLPGPDGSSPERITGVTLPGLPSIVVGSNGQVAWGFTNTGGDWSDLVRVEPDPRDNAKYLTPDGPRPFETFQETIVAKGAPSKAVNVRWTIWGPIVWTDARGREYAQRWIAHDADSLASDITRPERARSVDELVAAVSGLGIPNQNVTMADRSGRIGWTIGGAIPKRVGHDGSTPESWADGANRWDGYLSPSEFPRIVDPADGRIWTANAPVVGGKLLQTIGEGGYADGIRARLIRDRLMATESATPKDMLQIQLEDRALFLERWRSLLLTTLGTPGLQSSPAQTEFRRLIDTTWTGRATPDSVAYRLVRQFRTNFVREVMTTLTAPAKAVDPGFDYTRSFRGEGPVWQLVTERPLHLLSSKYKTWDDLILAMVDQSVTDLTEGGRALGERTWGESNRAQFLHPLASAIPYLGPRLNMPDDPLPGDVYTPRAQAPRTGPSERMVVSPGREEEGILHIPTGQSGHPLSPHYGDQYRSWLNGDASPFLPGPTVSMLTLTP